MLYSYVVLVYVRMYYYSIIQYMYSLIFRTVNFNVQFCFICFIIGNKFKTIIFAYWCEGALVENVLELVSTGRKFARVMSTGENLQELGARVGKICYSPGALLENLQELGSTGRKYARVGEPW